MKIFYIPILPLFLCVGCIGGTFTNEVWDRATNREVYFPRIEGIVQLNENKELSRTLTIIGYHRNATAPFFHGVHEYISIPMKNDFPVSPFYYTGSLKGLFIDLCG